MKHLEPPQPDVAVVTNNRLKQQSKHYKQNNPNCYISEQLTGMDITQLSVTIVMKRTIQLKREHVEKPRRLVVTIATTTRK